MSDDFAVGQKVGDYEILGVLGAGGMGKVYRVRNVISDRVEAMKILLGNLAGQKELADRFLREIKLLASLDHPNIAKLNTALTLNNQLVMLMEYVDGVTLASRLEKGPIPPADAVNYSEQLLSALSYAHKLNVIHRDVKPGNMMLTSQGVVKLMDFGIARPNNEVGMTLTGTTLGSLNYMSPEQVRGEAVDARSDLYSFGVSLYEMVTGQLPFRGNSNYSVMSAHLQEVPQPPVTLRPDLPKGLSEIIVMAMAKNANDRFQSADAFANALKTVVPGATATRPVTASAAPAVSAARPVATVPMQPAPQVAAAAASSTSHRGLYMALGGLLVVAILAFGAVYGPHWIKAHASGGSAQQSQAQPADQSQPAASQSSDAPVDISAAPDDAVPVAAPPSDTSSAAPAAAPLQDDAAAKAAAAAARKAQEEAARKAAELKEAQHQADQLDARAAAISQSLDNLRRQQEKMGYGLRGDMASAEELMKTNLSRAQSALDSQDGAKAKEYLDMAEAQAEKLESFLGR
jgi:eukaryotic-like serine/threonine-protein kinase